jgi:hypothetical protein
VVYCSNFTPYSHSSYPSAISDKALSPTTLNYIFIHIRALLHCSPLLLPSITSSPPCPILPSHFFFSPHSVNYLSINLYVNNIYFPNTHCL